MDVRGFALLQTVVGAEVHIVSQGPDEDEEVEFVAITGEEGAIADTLNKLSSVNSKTDPDATTQLRRLRLITITSGGMAVVAWLRDHSTGSIGKPAH